MNAQNDNRLKLYIVCSHVDKLMEQDYPKSVYEYQIQAGAALTDKRICELNDHDGFPESISDRNSRYSEVTAMWWIGKHLDTPYVGIEHYRRRLALTDEDIAKYMDKDIDIITTLPIQMSWSVEDNCRNEFWSADWDLFMSIIEEMAPLDLEFARECFAGNMIYCYNINIFKSELYRDFCEWAFPMLDAFYRRSPEKTDVMQHRDVGYIAERLSHLFVMKMKKMGKRVAEAGVIRLQSSDWQPEKECDLADPGEVWKACDRLYRQNRIRECNMMLAEALKRSGSEDERLRVLSDILSIAVLERRELPLTMHEYLPQELRQDLNTLTAVYDGFRKIVLLWHERDDDETAKLLSDYMKLTHFSTIAVGYIIDQAEKEMKS